MSLYDFRFERGWGDEEEPPAPDQADWLHVGAEQPREVVVLSSSPTRYLGHWHHPSQRFRCCSGSDRGRCPWCAAGLGRQKRYVVAVLEPATQAQWLWEFGMPQAGPIQALLRDGGELRGLALRLCRPPARGGRASVLVDRADPGEMGPLPCPLPDPVDVEALLFGTWVRQALKNGKASVDFAPPAPTAAPSSDPNRRPAKPAPSPDLPPPSPSCGPRTHRLRTVLVRRYGEKENEQEAK